MASHQSSDSPSSSITSDSVQFPGFDQTAQFILPNHQGTFHVCDRHHGCTMDDPNVCGTVGCNRVKAPSMKGRLCPYLTTFGMCNHMSSCVYSHTIEEVRGHNQHFKTKICEFAANGFCKKANLCRFAHSFSELGTPIGESTPEPVSATKEEGRNISSVSTHAAADPVDDNDPRSPIRHSGSLSPAFDGGSTTISPINESCLSSPSARVCYVAPRKQRSAFRQKWRPMQQAPAVVPSSFHYVDQVTKRRQHGVPTSSSACLPGLLPTPNPHITYPVVMYPQASAGQMAYSFGNSTGTPIIYGGPMMYNMVVRNVVYED